MCLLDRSNAASELKRIELCVYMAKLESRMKNIMTQRSSCFYSMNKLIKILSEFEELFICFVVTVRLRETHRRGPL